mmetsp:Transcript_22133/g.40693  ORF Transcript_22133/g.40693 Transcript_22133/m.40693 type:complete len:285 (-) Transcript_22133:54-908(-)
MHGNSHEPVQVIVVRTNGEHVADLCMSPLRSIEAVKCQIEGLEGTPVGKQQLLLEGHPADDAATLSSLGVQEVVTLELQLRLPVLSGSITVLDLRRLLQSETALVQAIDAFTDDPLYCMAEIHYITQSISQTLLPAAYSAAPRQWLDDEQATELEAPQGSGTRQARKARFTAALRQVLAALAEEIERVTAPAADFQEEAASEIAEGLSSSRSPPFMETSTSTSEERHRRSLAPAAHSDASEGAVDAPWRGAGRELQEHLHRRYTVTELKESVEQQEQGRTEDST